VLLPILSKGPARSVSFILPRFLLFCERCSTGALGFFYSAERCSTGALG